MARQEETANYPFSLYLLPLNDKQRATLGVPFPDGLGGKKSIKVEFSARKQSLHKN